MTTPSDPLNTSDPLDPDATTVLPRQVAEPRPGARHSQATPPDDQRTTGAATSGRSSEIGPASGGSSSGGAATGGSASGGAATGGSASGGAASGGSARGGAAGSGAAGGGAAGGGAAGSGAPGSSAAGGGAAGGAGADEGPSAGGPGVHPPLRSPTPECDDSATVVIRKDESATVIISKIVDPVPAAGPRPAVDAEADLELRGHRKSRRSGRRVARHRSPESRIADMVAQAATSKGEVVVPLRAVRTRQGYRSVYSELTRMTFRSVVLTTARVLGESLITFGLVVLLFAAYEVWGVGAKVDAHQNHLNDQLAQDWGRTPSPTVSASASVSPPPPMDGEGLAKLYIPRIKDKPWVVVQGVGVADIKYAPGHYPSTVMPGEIGNFSVAGHRTPAIFWDLDKMKPGDPIVVETRDSWFVYETTVLHIVSPKATEVVAPVPNQPGVAPTVAMLTLTTCNPKYDNYQRLVLHAQLVRSQAHDAGYPPELGR